MKLQSRSSQVAKTHYGEDKFEIITALEIFPRADADDDHRHRAA